MNPANIFYTGDGDRTRRIEDLLESGNALLIDKVTGEIYKGNLIESVGVFMAETKDGRGMYLYREALYTGGTVVLTGYTGYTGEKITVNVNDVVRRYRVTEVVTHEEEDSKKGA